MSDCPVVSRRDPRLDGVIDAGTASGSPHYLPNADSNKRQRTSVADVANPNCTIYIPNPSLLGAQVGILLSRTVPSRFV